MKRTLLILLMLLALPVTAQDNADNETEGDTITRSDCVEQLQLRRDAPDVLALVDEVRKIIDQADADGDTQPLPLSPAELEALLLYSNSDLTLDETMLVIGESYDSIVEVPQEIVVELLDQGDELDDAEGDTSVPACNYIMYHGDITVSCGGDTPFSTTQPTGNPPQPVRLTDRGEALVWNAGQGIVINLTPLDEGDTYVGQLERPEVTFRYVVQETDGAYQGTIQQLPAGEQACPDMLVISNFTLQPFGKQDAGAPDVEREPLFDMSDIWDTEDE